MSKIRLAVATEDGTHVNLHFGQAKKFTVIDLKEDGSWNVVEERTAENGEPGEEKETFSGCHGRDEKYVGQIAKQLSDCKYLILAKIGNYPSRILQREGIETLEKEGDLEEILIKLAAYYRKRERKFPKV